MRSIDIFRGLTMMVMIFVNDLAGVGGLPWWTYHMPGTLNGMTYVDVVFPVFLFIVGLTIPLAVRQRLARDPSPTSLWGHIVFRSLGLVVLGLVLANAGDVNATLTGVSANTWTLLALVGAIAFWGAYPRAAGRQRAVHTALRYGGLALLLVAAVIFRRTTRSGQTAWLDFSYWEILGLIGRAYLAACLLYIPLRTKRWAPALLLVGLTGISVASRLEWLPFLSHLPYWIWPFDAGELPSVVMAGVVAAHIMLDVDEPRPFRGKSIAGLAYAGGLFLAGWIFSPLGIVKDIATPSWCLYSAGIAMTSFVLLYWVVDIKGREAWAGFVRTAGSNTLLTYLLPDLFYFSGLSLDWTGMTEGGAGVVKSVIFTGLVLTASHVVTRLRIGMRL